MSEITQSIQGRAISAPVVEAPGDTPKRTDQEDGKDNPSNAALTVPSPQLFVALRFVIGR